MYKIKPEDYASLANNSDEINLKLIQLITNEKCSYDLIVDLGFGDGRVTRMLSENISHKQLVAIDVVPEMLAHAVANSSDDPSIEYVLQDMSVPWLELSPRIRQLESKVDLLFTNLTLNYMSNKRQIIEIIGRLLSSGGLFFANIILSDDLNDKQLLNSQTEDRQQQQQQQRQQLLYHSIDRQLNDWKQCLVDNGFDIKLFKRLTNNEIMTRKHIIDMMPDIFNTYAIYYNDRKQFDTEVKVDDHFMDKVFNAYFSLPDKSVSASASVSVANHPMLLSWKQFFKDNSIHELMHSFQYLQLMAYNKYNK